ncbi:MAG: outer membrane lipoprotein carrier protein LolA [Phycisphaerae bacterium]
MTRTLCLALMLAIGLAAFAQTAAPAPATIAPSTGPAPTDTPTVGQAEKKILDDLQAAGDKFPTLTAKVLYTTSNPAEESVEIRTGDLSYQKDTDKEPMKLLISFDKVTRADVGPGGELLNKKTFPERVLYALDGQWFTVMKFRINQMTRYQVAAAGEKVEPLRVGQGPFPLPFGQKAAEVIKFFEVKTRAPAADDPKNTVYLELTPRAANAKSVGFTKLQMWIDRDTNLPVKLVSTEKDGTVKSGEFSEIKTGEKFDQKIFSPEKPAGWDLTVEPLKKQ